MAIRINDNSSAFVGRVVPSFDDFTASIEGDFTPAANNNFTGTLDRAMGAFTARFADLDWPLNGHALMGNYGIAAQDRQTTDEPNGIPGLTWNSEKDVVIIQALGWTSDNLNDLAAERLKRLKDANPATKILWYFLPAEVSKPSALGTNITTTENYVLINSGTRGNTNWYQVDEFGNKVESQFDPSRVHRANAYVPQFNGLNSFGNTMILQYFIEHFEMMVETRSNGERLFDLVDGLYWDALDSGLEKTFVDGSNGGTSIQPDQNRDGDPEDRYGEFIPPNPDNEDGYGGARMQRRGAVTGLGYYRDLFGPTKVMGRNGSKDGLDYYLSQGDGSPYSDPPDTNEFYQQFDLSLDEFFDTAIGLTAAGNGVYDVRYDNFEIGLQRLVIGRKMVKPADQHPWGPFGFYAHPMVVNMNDSDTYDDIQQLDFEASRFYGAINAICGTMFCPYMNTNEGWPRIDEYMYVWGDSVNNDYPTRIGDPDMSTVGGETTLRPYDYQSGGVKVYWEEFENVLWIVRGDPPPVGLGQYGNGSPASIPLPSAGAGKKWIFPDLTNYTHPTRGWTTRNNSPSIYDGSDAGSSISMLPWHGRMLARVDA